MPSVCGIDVSKNRLDIMVLPEQQYFSVRNDAAGWAELIERLRGPRSRRSVWKRAEGTNAAR